MNQPIVYDGQPSSNLFKILLKKLKPQLSGAGIDERVSDVASRKLAKFVENIMREAYLKQKHERRRQIRPSSAFPSSETHIEKNETIRAKTADCPVRQPKFSYNRNHSREETIMRDLGSPNRESESFMRIEKVPKSYVRDVRKTSPSRKAEICGRRVYTPETGRGDQTSSNTSRPSTVETDGKRGRNDGGSRSGRRSEWPDKKSTPQRSSEIRNSSSNWTSVVGNSSQVQNSGYVDHKVIAREFRNKRRDSSSDSYMSSTSDAKSPIYSNRQSIASQERSSRPHTSNDDRSSKVDNHTTRIRSTDSKGYSFSISKIYPTT
ncbi:Hypothetical protein NTJ_08573 [Nesidiocoris tenuis]|uniref:Uncharacterized protein n=1 Tax=Nesidiocoris tenuis TaxID=355587 RepID=A0ABN7AW55_9HEMI|nr:Hypothetical protein NTJ_08573 [Nesidiocoris tenuis]